MGALTGYLQDAFERLGPHPVQHSWTTLSREQERV
jgi:hypothetical protein